MKARMNPDSSPSVAPAESMRLLQRYSRLLVIAIIVGVSLSQMILIIGDWHLRDADAYWNAALRLRAGEPLYPPLANSEASEVFRYAPWFAWLWVPLTYLPHELVRVLWSVVLLAASAVALIPLARARAWLLVAFFGFILVGISGPGNVQPLLIASLVWGLERRSGPVWIALAASLKVVPILFAVTYVGRGEWKRAAVAVALTGVLVAPMLMHDLSHYPATAGPAAGLISMPLLYAAVVAAGILVSLRASRTPFAWLASAATVTVAVPRFFVYDISFVLAAMPSGLRLRRDPPGRGPNTPL